MEMTVRLTSRATWAVCLIGIILLGIFSRVVHTGWLIFDKYLGDALYAAMIYTILRAWSRPTAAVVSSAIVMTALELFQLTMIPAHLLQSGHLVIRIVARLMGTDFSFLDLAAYGVGIGCVYLVDQRKKGPAEIPTGPREGRRKSTNRSTRRT
jgi:Protein of unknown function (DUF2809)